MVWQKEKGENGTVHLQGYVAFSVRKSLATMKNVNGSAHWEVRRGTHDEAKAYCMKPESREAGPWEEGQIFEMTTNRMF